MTQIVEDIKRVDCHNSEVEAYLRKLLKIMPADSDHAETKSNDTTSITSGVELRKEKKEVSTIRICRHVPTYTVHSVNWISASLC